MVITYVQRKFFTNDLETFFRPNDVSYWFIV